MITDTSVIEGRIEAERRSLGNNLRELEVRAKTAADWRTYVRKRPWPTLAVAVAGGALLSELLRSRGSALGPGGDGRGGDGLAGPRPSVPVDEAWQHIKAAIVVAAVTEAAELFRETFPRFHKTFVGAMNDGQKSEDHYTTR
jgi:hypothetical protein